jgi:hypothetical protein
MSRKPSVSSGAPLCLLAALAVYLYLEGTVTHQLVAIAFTVATLYESQADRNQRLVILLTLFLSAASGLYGLLYGFSAISITLVLLIWVGFVLLQQGWLPGKMEFRRFVAALATFLLVLLLCDLASRSVLPSALLAATLTGLLVEIPVKRSRLPWPHWQSYAMVVVLSVVLILVSPAAFHAS